MTKPEGERLMRLAQAAKMISFWPLVNAVCAAMVANFFPEPGEEALFDAEWGTADPDGGDPTQVKYDLVILRGPAPEGADTLCLPVPLLRSEVALAILKASRNHVVPIGSRREQERETEPLTPSRYWDALANIVPLHQVATWLTKYFDPIWVNEYFKATPLATFLPVGGTPDGSA